MLTSNLFGSIFPQKCHFARILYDTSIRLKYANFSAKKMG